MKREHEALALVRNMSAPPRTTLTFAALAPKASTQVQGDPVSAGTGLQFVCRLNPRSHLPAARQQTGADAANDDEAHMHSRIRAAILYARAEASGNAEVSEKAVALVRADPIEALADELQSLLVAASVRVAPNEVALPAVGVLLPFKCDAVRPVLPGFTRTLAILGRRRGSLFLRAAQPIVWAALHGTPMDLWSPVVRTRSVA